MISADHARILEIPANRLFKLPEPQNEAKCIELLEGFYVILQDFRTKPISNAGFFFCRRLQAERGTLITRMV
jgi:hypothetical protein